MARTKATNPDRGIETRHRAGCPQRPCACPDGPRYRASITVDGQLVRAPQSFAKLTDARAWRDNAERLRADGENIPADRRAAREHFADFMAAARRGAARNRSGKTYKAGVLAGYERAFNNHLDPLLGAKPVSSIRQDFLQGLVDEMQTQRTGTPGNYRTISPSTVQNNFMPLRVLFAWLKRRGVVADNPTEGLLMPQGEQERERIPDPAELRRLLLNVRDDHRVIWALAGYAGLRRNEIRALRNQDVDLRGGVIRVRQSWDDHEQQPGPLKTKAAKRDIPIIAPLRPILEGHQLRKQVESYARGDHDLLAGRPEDGGPLASSNIQRQADKRWFAAGQERITLHEARHGYASTSIAAGVNARALMGMMGHTSITVTYDRYGHLFPGALDEAAELIDTYLARLDAAAEHQEA